MSPDIFSASDEDNNVGNSGIGTLTQTDPHLPAAQPEPEPEPVDPVTQYEIDEKDKPDPDMPRIPVGESENVRLAKSKDHQALPSGNTSIGGTLVVVPKKNQQLTGFYTPHASVFVHQFPQYKFIQKKGEERPR